MSISPQTLSLFNAIRANNLPAIKAALKTGADLDGVFHEPPHHPRNPLEEAAYVGSAEAVATLLSAGCKIRSEDQILRYAIMGDNLVVLQKILDIVTPQSFTGGTSGKDIPLMLAALRGRLDMCRLLVERGADFKVCFFNGMNLIGHTLARRNPNNSSGQSIVDLVEFLLDSGVPLNEDASLDTSGLIIRMAITFCLNDQKLATEGIATKLCELLINRGADVSAVGATEETAIHLVAKTSPCRQVCPVFDHALIPLLVKSGLGVNTKNNIGRAPLHDAAASDNVFVLKQLIELGANPNALDDCGNTALVWAAKSDNVEAARILLEGGTDPSICNITGRNPESYALEEHECSAVVALLHALRDQKKLEDGVLKAPGDAIKLRL
jgi:ankyrin repeat protein